MNSNCLVGIACPVCEADGEFQIRAKALFTVTDDGTGCFTDVEWDDDSFILCNTCGQHGKVKDFKEKEE